MTEQLTYRTIFRFWSPLALTWMMMAIEGPLLAAIIARLPAEVTNLAAYGVAYAFALVAEAPVIMLMSAVTALCKGTESYRQLRRFTLMLSLGVTLFLAFLAVPPVFRMIGGELLGLQPEVVRETQVAIWLLLPWPGAIGLRRFYQGLLIADRRTRRVTAGTLARVAGMALTGLAAAASGRFPGAAVGALALSSGVVLEMLATRRLARPSIAAFLERQEPQDAPGFREIWCLYLPLAMTPFIALSIQPVVTFFLARGTASLESLAVLPVLYGLTFFFRALGLSYHEAAVALLGDRLQHRRLVGRFALVLGIACVGLLGLIALTPLAKFWLADVSGLSAELTRFARMPLILMVLMPGLTTWISWQRSVLLTVRVTRPISLATGAEAVTVFLLLAVLVPHLPWPGISLAAIALAAGRLLGILVLARYCRPVLQAARREEA